MTPYEIKMQMLAECKPEKKDLLLLKLLRGQTVDITKDADLFFQVNKDRVDMNQFTERDKFNQAAEAVKAQKEGMFHADGSTKEKKMKWLGDIPNEVFFSRPEFSPLLSAEERGRNAKKWLNEFNAFRAGDKRL